MDIKLGREVLDAADAEAAYLRAADRRVRGVPGSPRPEPPRHRFSMGVWGNLSGCGTVGCLAGTALLLRGYRITGLNEFSRPDGTAVPVRCPQEFLSSDIAEEAARVLDMSEDEEFRTAEASPWRAADKIWYDIENGLERFRCLVEDAEAKAAAARGELG
jgi:hypothetical protein